MKIITIIGARPQFIKASILSDLFKKNDFFSEKIIHTGQHFDSNMSQIFFNEMRLPRPDYNLNINQMNHGQMTAKMMEKIEPIIINDDPDGVLVYGDTNSTLAGSLTAAKLGIPVFHVEAGLRSYNRSMPEEINRILTDHISTLLFCPNQNAVNLLAKEGIKKGVFNSGDIMYDTFLKFSNLNEKINKKLSSQNLPYILTTIHRQENTNNKEKLISIFNSLEKINNKTKIIFPMHPRTYEKLKKLNISTKIEFIKPVGYLSMLALLNSAEIVITDSGGLQKEAFFAKKKCITVREETEWTELIEINVNCLSSPADLYDNFEKMKNKECDFSKKLYGHGNSGQIILDSIIKYFN